MAARGDSVSWCMVFMATLLLPPDDWSKVDTFFRSVSSWVGEYRELPMTWRVPFRMELHFASMVDDYIGSHIHKIFHLERMMKAAATLVKEENRLTDLRRVLLDIHTEQYLRYAGLFYSTLTRTGFTPVVEASRDREAHTIILTLSLSGLYFSPGGLTGARRYLYTSIYDNDDIPQGGTCLITSDMRMLHRVKTSSFVSSPVLFLFESREGWEVADIQKSVFESVATRYSALKDDLDRELLSHMAYFMTHGMPSGEMTIQPDKILAFPAEQPKKRGDTLI